MSSYAVGKLKVKTCPILIKAKKNIKINPMSINAFVIKKHVMN